MFFGGPWNVICDKSPVEWFKAFNLRTRHIHLCSILVVLSAVQTHWSLESIPTQNKNSYCEMGDILRSYTL